MKFRVWLAKRQGSVTSIGDIADDIRDMQRLGAIPAEILESDERDVWLQFLMQRGATKLYLENFWRAFGSYQGAHRS